MRTDCCYFLLKLCRLILPAMLLMAYIQAAIFINCDWNLWNNETLCAQVCIWSNLFMVECKCTQTWWSDQKIGHYWVPRYNFVSIIIIYLKMLIILLTTDCKRAILSSASGLLLKCNLTVSRCLHGVFIQFKESRNLRSLAVPYWIIFITIPNK